MKENEKNTLLVTDESKTFEQTKDFTYKKLIAPSAVLIAAESGNAENQVNSSNVSNTAITVNFEGGNKNELPVTLEVTIKDSKDNVITLTKQLTSKLTNEEVRGNLSSLEEGKLTLSALVRDGDGNVSASTPEVEATKLANAPVVTYESVKRDNTTTAKITNLKSTNSDDSENKDDIYYLVQGIDKPEPTVDEVMSKGSKITVESPDSSATIPDEFKDTACVIYVVAQTKSGTESEKVLAIKVAKVDATEMEGEVTLQKVTGTDVTYSWDFDEETDGFEGYRVILKDQAGKILYEKIVNKGETREVNFFDTLKKQEAGTYTISVTAIADNVDYTDVTSDEVTITTSPVLTNMSVSLDKEKNTITWEQVGDVKNVENYTIEVMKYDPSKEAGKEYETIVSSATVSSIVDYDITPIVEKNGIGTYSFKVTANAKDNVLMASASSADITKASGDTDTYSNIKYHQGIGLSDLSAEIKNGNVALKGSLLSEEVFDVKSSAKAGLVEYKLYYKVATDKSYTGEGIEVTELPYELTNQLNPGTQYKFMIMTTVDGNKYYSNEPSATTPITPIVIDNAKYKKLEENSPVIPSLNNKEVTYNNGVLYVNNNGSMVEYSSEVYPEVLDIVNVLEQMGENDTISVNGKITNLTLKASAEKTTTYDLTKVPKTAKVEITGDPTYATTVKGDLNEITLKTASAKFNLNELEVGNVKVEDNTIDLTVKPDTTLTFGSEKTEATINGIKLTQDTTLASVKTTENGFRFTGSDNKLTIDASKSTNNITVEFVGTNQKGLEITANENNAVAVLTNEQEISDLEIKQGKVDLKNAVFNTLKLGGVTGTNKVTLITNSTNTNKNIVGEKLPNTPVLIDWLGYYLTASVADKAAYSSDKDSNTIVFTLENSATVVLNKKTDTLVANKTKEVDNTPMKDDSNKEQYETNMNAIQNVSVDSTTNTITVKVNENMKKYSATQGNHAYYTLLIDVGVPRENLETGRDKGQKYYELTENDITASEAYGASSTEVLVWLYAEDTESIVDFVTKTGEHYFFTIKVVGYQE